MALELCFLSLVTIDNIGFKSILFKREKLDLVKTVFSPQVICHLKMARENQGVELKVTRKKQQPCFICGFAEILKLVLFLS